MAKIGEELPQSEKGWKRYDDKFPAIKYTGEWFRTNIRSYTEGTTDSSNHMSFFIIGSKLRILGAMTPSTNLFSSSNVKVEIDGVVHTFANNALASKENSITKALLFEIILNEGVHFVKIYLNESGKRFWFDALDIDEDGRLMHTDEVTELQNLAIGKRIRCYYQATSNQVGVFSGLGKETSDFIPPDSSATPNGDFYFICVDKDHLGRWKLIADRNIQHSISWDTLNSAGIASGSGYETIFDSVVLDSNSINSGNIGNDMLSFTSQNSSSRVRATKGKGSGKWYWEVTKISGDNYARMIGVCAQNWSDITVDAYNGVLSWENNNKTFIAPFNAIGSTLGIALDLDNKFIDFYIDGKLSGRIEEQLIGLQGLIYPYSWSRSNMSGINWRFNFGASPFKYSIPEGFLPYGFKEKEDKYTIRLLTGGVSTTDKDNEWDEYIVHSDLNGKIQASDDIVWNWNNNSPSWTSTTQTNALRRVRRGGAGEGVGAYYGDRAVFSETSRAGDSSGFRPVLLLESKVNKSFILYNNEAYYYTSEWVNIGKIPENNDKKKQLFEQYGMEHDITGQQLKEFKKMLLTE